MKLDPAVLAIPLYALFIGGELWLSRRPRDGLARSWEDLLVNVGAGLGQLATDVLLGLLYVVPYAALAAHAPRSLSETAVTTWLLAFLGVDLGFYWQHRLSHRVGLFWAAHAVHHQGEDYNLGLALRQPWFSVLINWVYYLPLAVVGVPVTVFLGAAGLNLVYQFFLHTRAIRTLGPLEWVLNTPSHHRVHHGRDADYLDCNYGGVFIIWDRLFGTFRQEHREPSFGTVEPFRSWNPAWANFEHLALLARKRRACDGLVDKVLAYLRPPEWSPPGLPAAPAPAAAPTPGLRQRSYATWLLMEALAGTVALVMWKAQLGWLAKVSGVGLVVATLMVMGGLLDGRPWFKPAELIRRAALVLTLGTALLIGGWL
ncbi:MAG: sterol desaturase family protein [Myxococcales bacterium]|nr:sterol desaturase family protein [Myxococcales bacterium]